MTHQALAEDFVRVQVRGVLSPEGLERAEHVGEAFERSLEDLVQSVPVLSVDLALKTLCRSGEEDLPGRARRLCALARVVPEGDDLCLEDLCWDKHLCEHRPLDLESCADEQVSRERAAVGSVLCEQRVRVRERRLIKVLVAVLSVGREERGRIDEELVEPVDGGRDEEAADGRGEAEERWEVERVRDGRERAVQSVEDRDRVDDHIQGCKVDQTVNLMPGWEKARRESVRD